MKALDYLAIGVFFAMLFGIGCAAHLVKRDMSLSKILYSRKVGAVKQVISENAAYFIFMFCFVFILLVIAVVNTIEIIIKHFQLADT